MATTETKYGDLGRKLRSARKRCGISQENLAAKVGITRRHLIRLEFGHHLPGLSLRAAIAEATGIDAATLRVPEDDDEEEPDPAMADAFRLFTDLMRSLAAQGAVPATAVGDEASA